MKVIVSVYTDPWIGKYHHHAANRFHWLHSAIKNVNLHFWISCFSGILLRYNIKHKNTMCVITFNFTKIFANDCCRLYSLWKSKLIEKTPFDVESMKFILLVIKFSEAFYSFFFWKSEWTDEAQSQQAMAQRNWKLTFFGILPDVVVKVMNKEVNK